MSERQQSRMLLGEPWPGGHLPDDPLRISLERLWPRSDTREPSELESALNSVFPLRDFSGTCELTYISCQRRSGSLIVPGGRPAPGFSVGAGVGMPRSVLVGAGVVGRPTGATVEVAVGAGDGRPVGVGTDGTGASRPAGVVATGVGDGRLAGVAAAGVVATGVAVGVLATGVGCAAVWGAGACGTTGPWRLGAETLERVGELGPGLPPPSALTTQPRASVEPRTRAVRCVSFIENLRECRGGQPGDRLRRGRSRPFGTGRRPWTFNGNRSHLPRGPWRWCEGCERLASQAPDGDRGRTARRA